MSFDAICDAGIVPAQLWLEIPETLIGRSADAVAANFAELRSYGFRTIIERFGNGFGSLQQLKRLPIDGVKIDRAFLDDTKAPDRADGNRAIFNAIVTMSRALHLEVVADGVETSAQIALAFGSGCSRVQGRVFGDALPEDVFIGWSPSTQAWSSKQSEPPEPNAERAAIERLRLRCPIIA